jgi:hypothetical protein
MRLNNVTNNKPKIKAYLDKKMSSVVENTHWSVGSANSIGSALNKNN